MMVNGDAINAIDAIDDIDDIDDIDTVRYVDQKGYYEKYINNNIRPSGRDMHNIRPITMKKGVFNSNNNSSNSNSKCCGSSYIELGNTKVSCGIKILIGTPSIYKPTCGDTEIDISLWQICSPKYDQKSKSDIALVLESQLQSLVMDTNMIDLEQLCIQEGKAAFRLRISIVLLSDAGNLFDAMVLSLVSALNDVKLPNTMIDENSGDVSVSDEFITPLKLSKIPIAITIGIFNDKIITDLDEKEEALMHGYITIVFDEFHNMCYISQSASTATVKGFSIQTITNAISLCHDKAVEVRNSINDII